MASSTIDSAVYAPLFATNEMKEIFSDRNLVQKWLDTEAALAQAEGELGIIPADAAKEITENAKAELLTPYTQIGENYKSSITIVPLLKEFKKVLKNNAGEFVHWGATSQDIVDTGLVLRIREAHARISEMVKDCIKAGKVQARKYRDVVECGRTHVQHALPITFGFKVASWVFELERHAQRLEEIKPRLFMIELFGAAGTLASLGENGPAVQRRTAEILDLSLPPIMWHPQRDHIAEFVSLLALIAGTLTRITHEVLTLQRTEIGEVEEPFFMGKVGSSTMPHKRNPQVAENVIALCRMVRSQAPLAVECMNCEHERDWSNEIAEWDFIPNACIHLDAALEKTLDIIKNMIVYPDKMEKNLNFLHGLMMSEAVMLNLGHEIGRLTAHDVVYENSMKAFEQQRPLKELLAEDERVNKKLSSEQIDAMLDPHNYIGIAQASVDALCKE